MMTNAISYFNKPILTPKSTDGCIADVGINSNHDIFEGHFPDQPILPGVCQMEIVAEVLSAYIGGKCLLIASSSIKFLHMIDPSVMVLLSIDITILSKDQENIKIKASIHSNDTLCLKCISLFRIID